MKQKKQLLDEFAKDRKSKVLDESVVSINHDQVDTQPLLSGDHSEELRQQDRLYEKKENAAEGKMKRVTKADIRNSQQVESPTGVMEEQKQLDDILDGSMQMQAKSRAQTRRETKRNANNPMLSPSGGTKYDANLKKKLLADEKERVDKAKRDAADERNRELEEFKRSGSATPSNVVMPKY